VANQQRNAQVFLKLLDLHAERGLRHVQLVGRPRHVAGIDDADEVFQLPKIQIALSDEIYRKRKSLSRQCLPWMMPE
jgi:hypothetical protein